jgi:hypothetical protein
MAATPLNQDDEVNRLVETLKDQLKHEYSPPQVKRDAHPKMHGCVQAEFIVDDEVPEDLARGVFAYRGRTFDAWVRFSNAFGIQHDIEFETRGMAIKVLGVPGQKLESDVDGVPPEKREVEGEGSQDFLMATHDAFFLPDVDEYAEFAEAVAEGPAQITLFFLRRPRLWRGWRASLRSTFVLARSPLAICYFSQTPYRLGAEKPPSHAVKFQARPILTRSLVDSLPLPTSFVVQSLAGNVVLLLLEMLGPKQKAEAFCDRHIAHRDRLRHALMSFLGAHDAWFELLVQTREDSPAMPIEDPTVSWGEYFSPFRKVATVRIPRQVFWPEPGLPTRIVEATAEMMELGENMSFNPWHALPDHEPLGAINEARRQVYQAIVDFRRGQNAVPTPTRADAYKRLRPIVQHGLISQ